jgi:uncharacterized membrane protein
MERLILNQKRFPRCCVDDPRLPRTAYAFLALSCLLLMAFYYPKMPQRMASHFAADGSPNGWLPREAFFLLMLLVTASSAVTVFFAPWQIARKSNARFNLPNRDYWLAPERREATMRIVAALMAWFGCGILFVLIAGTYLALQANLAPDHHFNSEAMLVVLAAFFIVLIFLIVGFVRRFQHIPSHS